MFHVEQNNNSDKNMFHVEQNQEGAKTCLICESDSLVFYSDCPDHFLSKEPFQLYQCPNCNTLITLPRPDESQIFKYYNSEEYVSHNDSNSGLINKIYQIVKRHALNSKRKLITPLLNGGPLLDFGCGTGSFIEECSNKGISSFGAEPDISAKTIALKKGLNVTSPEELSSSAQKFGVITMWHVLEHTYDPVATIKQLKSMLLPDGYLVIAVPNYMSFDAQHYGNNWAAYDVPRHLFHFTQQSLKTIAIKTNMKLQKTLPMYFDSFYVSMLSEKYKGGNFISGIITGLRSNINAKNNRNYSSLIYILKK
jgi:2-polyprenyl-3-methyl-5-hydroxy-6-metoxy-1,4-benzoquinol methylase